MNKAFWIAVLAYLVPTFPLGYFWHLVTFHEAYAQLDMYRQEVIIPMGLGSMAIQACCFAWAYPRLFSTDRAQFARSAATAFVMFGALAWSFTTLPVAAKYQMTSVSLFMLLETAFTFVQFILVAPLIALAWRQPARSAQDDSAKVHRPGAAS